MMPRSKSANDSNITTKCRCGIVAYRAITKVELLSAISGGSDVGGSDVGGSDVGKAAVAVPIPHMCSQQSVDFAQILISYKQPKPSNVGVIKLAPVTFGASPIDPALHRTSPSRTRDLPNFESASASSLLPSASHLSRPSSPSTESSSPNLRPQHQSKRDRNLSYSASLPGLSTLASVASAPSSHLRAYETKDRASSNQNASRNMSYATSSPGATTGGQGNTPVSAIHEMFSQFLLHNVAPLANGHFPRIACLGMAQIWAWQPSSQ
ncbi:predicted protein [Histoplasma capsulatum G186AR]|uniref:Uncharacterized protein n=1 Tax=Ajellomyces capsulatus (strain G186AR / H82 / ATCC MYA-2454 / RMSCC 2432) TaxID=447093 RepID=C0NSL4_AJECG|nr:uncharacterized protein HCBG_06144 [Histoplasma capsulatum G186AR]EEH05880.1 predicted protein [Histoplasma capsulatum G186AR]